MSLVLVKEATTDEYSFGGAGDDPIPNTVTLDDDNVPPEMTSNVVIFQIRATNYTYEGISLAVINEETGINYQLSLDNINYFESLVSGNGGDANGEIADIDATGGAVTKDVYAKVFVANDGSITAGTKTVPKMRLISTEVQ